MPTINYAGRNWQGCSCLAEWLPVVTALMIKRGLLKSHLDITQLSYNTSVGASAGTHSGGGAGDCKQYSVEQVKLMRECGAFASDRLPSEGPWGRHNHFLLVDCPHLSAAAKRQVADYRKGLNGLANKRADRGPKVAIKSWKNGLAWAREQLNPTPKPVNIDQLARDTIAGKYGNGDARKKALGANYAAVQKRVNELIKKPAPKPISFSHMMKSVPNKGINGNVRIVQDILRALGHYPYKSDGVYGPKTIAAYAAYQRSLGYRGKDADGIPGWTSFTKLVARGGWQAVK